jgi:hypothetical protein
MPERTERKETKIALGFVQPEIYVILQSGLSAPVRFEDPQLTAVFRIPGKDVPKVHSTQGKRTKVGHVRCQVCV